MVDLFENIAANVTWDTFSDVNNTYFVSSQNDHDVIDLVPTLSTLAARPIFFEDTVSPVMNSLNGFLKTKLYCVARPFCVLHTSHFQGTVNLKKSYEDVPFIVIIYLPVNRPKSYHIYFIIIWEGLYHCHYT